ncbi:MAG: 23S rRNA (uracil(1939)-C(5))-methyltransferase RlmD [Lachnospiraceae bacterium]|nr:23S rRNA (uracil(1939)-C(5))-methyltransferase RlmD [Lachnospiraceae bacterium]
MKKGQEYTAVVDYVNFPNKGIVRVEGEKIVVKGVLPGQEVRFQLQKASAGKKEGRLLEVVFASEREGRVPPCPHFGKCGGCSYQTMPYAEQLRLKEEQVRRLLEAVLQKTCEWEGILASPAEFGYRNKMEYSFGDERKDGPLTLGLHKKGSFYDVLTTGSCRIVHDDFNRLLVRTLELAEQFDLTYYHKLTHQGYLRHLLVRRAVKTGEILIHLVTSSGLAEEKEKEFLRVWASEMKELELSGSVRGIIHIVNDHVADAIIADQVEILDGDDFFYEELLGLKFKISTFSFFQTNSLGAEVLYEKAREYVGETKDRIVFDLYSGTGTIAQLLAPVAKKVIGVEIVEEAVLAARENALLNGLENCEFLSGDVLRVLDGIEEKPDLIVLDPPREGIHPKALQKIISYGVEQIVYISCKPTSLARDLTPLQEAGYEVKKICMVDMFPQTVNVETVCLLSKPNARQL